MGIDTFQLFNGYSRPAWAGQVHIGDNQPGALSGDPLVPGFNARSIHGIVVPVTTKGRKGAPSAFSGQHTGKAHGTDRGHLMGLELGGPDISENIAPQTSLWQQSGGWRNLEKDILGYALEKMGWPGPANPGCLSLTVQHGGPATPSCAIYFRIGPSHDRQANGEPQSYDGNIVLVTLMESSPGVWTFKPDYRQWYKYFNIVPNGVSWR